MQAAKLAGPDAPSQKYDLLAALGSHALAKSPTLQRTALRFITLVTARYNWRRGFLSVGQREIARLWSVDERTVKREMARLREMGWIVLRSQGRRGRVASYALDIDAIRGQTRDGWGRIGPDFETRMGAGRPETASGTNGATGKVVPFPQPERAPMPSEGLEETSGAADPDSGWETALRRLRAEDADVFANWFAPLRPGGRAGESLTLIAPTAFDAAYIRSHYLDRLTRACRGCGLARELRLVAAGTAEAV